MRRPVKAQHRDPLNREWPELSNEEEAAVAAICRECEKRDACTNTEDIACGIVVDRMIEWTQEQEAADYDAELEMGEQRADAALDRQEWI